MQEWWQPVDAGAAYRGTCAIYCAPFSILESMNSSACLGIAFSGTLTTPHEPPNILRGTSWCVLPDRSGGEGPVLGVIPVALCTHRSPHGGPGLWQLRRELGERRQPVCRGSSACVTTAGSSWYGWVRCGWCCRTHLPKAAVATESMLAGEQAAQAGRWQRMGQGAGCSRHRDPGGKGALAL
jgi:hypothetical protein